MNIERINELSRISRERELTEEEKNEREILRNEYRVAVKRSLLGELTSAGLLTEVGGTTE
jgi:uncharacterized protein YnzC (UPF0291/DUF896 family)